MQRIQKNVAYRIYERMYITILYKYEPRRLHVFAFIDIINWYDYR